MAKPAFLVAKGKSDNDADDQKRGFPKGKGTPPVTKGGDKMALPFRKKGKGK